MRIRAAVVERKGAAPVVEELELSEPLGDEVLVRIEAAGICHTDLAWANGAFGRVRPVVLGHEIAGLVERVGPDVRGVAPGARVVVALTNHCGRCVQCEQGRQVLCLERDERRQRLRRGGREIVQGFGAGGFAEATIVRERALVVVPDDVDPALAAIVGCSVVTGFGAVLRVASLDAGASVLVVGCGAVGAAAVMAARLGGAGRIVAVDPRSSSRAVALKVGADEAAAGEDLPPESFDVVIEAAGTAAGATTAIGRAARGGTVVLAGLPRRGTRARVDLQELVIGHRRILGCNLGEVRPSVDIPRCLDLHRSGRIDLLPLVTRRYGLDGVARAFEGWQQAGGMRTVIEPNRQDPRAVPPAFR